MRRGGGTRSGSLRQRGSLQCAPPSVNSAPTSSPAVRLPVKATVAQVMFGKPLLNNVLRLDHVQLQN